MKDRKTFAYQALINETIRQLAHRFTPSLPMVKQAIERLIEKEYLDRSETDRKTLHYLVRPATFFFLLVTIN
jgi:predicted transcriptional regulator